MGPSGQVGGQPGEGYGQYYTLSPARPQHQSLGNHYHTLPTYHAQSQNRNADINQMERAYPPPSLSRHTVKVLQMPIMVVRDTNSPGAVPINPTVVTINSSPSHSPSPKPMIYAPGSGQGPSVPSPSSSPSPRSSSTSSSSTSYPQSSYGTPIHTMHPGQGYFPPQQDTWSNAPSQTAHEAHWNKGQSGSIQNIQPNQVYSAPQHDTWPKTPPKSGAQDISWNKVHSGSGHNVTVHPEHIYSEPQHDTWPRVHNKTPDDQNWNKVQSGSVHIVQPEHIYSEPQHDTWPKLHNQSLEEPNWNNTQGSSVPTLQPEHIYSEPQHDTWPKGHPTTAGDANWNKVQSSSNSQDDVNTRMRTMQQDMERMQRQMQDQFRHLQVAPPPAPLSLGGDQQGFPNFPPIMPPPLTKFPDSLIDIRPPSVQNLGLSSSPMMEANFPTMMKPEMAMQTIMDNDPENKSGKKQLKLQLDMHDFNPDEVRVRADKNKLEVSAHHEEKDPNRVTCRVFKQQYHLPTNVRMAKMQYNMTPEGELRVEGTVKPRHRVKFAENTLTK